ncbi:hypothetical protein [Hymenobacter baengnokdamensis]|uniref:hypothetical protein n=1 Tax=Hymenobacter baengnokdamensis TaxID=2615203 RepID=UPI0012492B99|nr:hypothetical protein [Hymenobacter baengnokdamensis]
MLFLKRIVTVLALVYLLLALLILFFPFVRTSTVNIFSIYSQTMEINLLLGFAWASVVVVTLLLIFENIDSSLLRRSVTQQDHKINELKAQLYDVKKPLAPPTSGPAAPYPTAYDAPPTTPPTY